MLRRLSLHALSVCLRPKIPLQILFPIPYMHGLLLARSRLYLQSEFCLLPWSYFIHLYKFMFPCFFHGCISLLVDNVSRARIIIGLVSIGSITKSIIPFSAAIYGLANFSLYSFARAFLVLAKFSDFLRSRRCIIVIAASGPRTAISAVGHAKFTSALRFLLPIAM